MRRNHGTLWYAAISKSSVPQMAERAQVLDWFDGDEPTWEWEHDPFFVPPRHQRIVGSYLFAWWQFTLYCAFHPNQVAPEWRTSKGTP